jgi:hypothetical protein
MKGGKARSRHCDPPHTSEPAETLGYAKVRETRTNLSERNRAEGVMMARAKRNTLRRGSIDMNRQQRQEQPEVPGATGTREEVSPEVAQVKARKRRGKTKKHISEDTPAG